MSATFLGIDCSGIVAEMTLIADSGQALSLREDTPRQADVIFPLLEKLLSTAQSDLKNIRAIGAIAGPGSFTGIRVGLSLAQGLADGLGVPAFGLSGFDALAQRDAHVSEPKDYIYVLESKRDELYVKIGNDVKMMRAEDILKYAKTVIHNLGDNSYFLPASVSLSAAAARHAQTCFDQNRPREILAPYYVRDADAKPNAT